MAESTDKAAKSAEEAYAAAAAAKPAKSEPAETAPAASEEPAVAASTPAENPVAAKAEAPKPAPLRKPAAPKTEAKATNKPAAKKPVARAKPAQTFTRTKSRPRRMAVAKTPPAAGTAPKPTITDLKEKIMAAAKTPDFTKPFTEAMSEMQTKAKAAYDKGTEVATEMTEFAKGNVEAFVESGKLLAGGMQDLGKAYVEEAKSAYETMTADLKDVASIKSPTDLFQLQGKLARRNFDAMIAIGSKNSDAMMKLATEAFAPVTSRVTLAAEKFSKAA